MSLSSDSSKAFGRRHRTVEAIDLLIYDYAQMRIRVTTLPVHSIFQPWEPHDDWRGEKVPVTLGDNASQFDWGMKSNKACFFNWNDFFAKCQLAEEQGPWDVNKDISRLLQSSGAGRSGSIGALRDGARSLQAPALIPSSELLSKDYRGRTRLFYAAEWGDQKAVEGMIFGLPGTGFYPQRLGFIESKDVDGLTAADVAEQNGHDEIAKLLRYQAWFMETYG